MTELSRVLQLTTSHLSPLRAYPDDRVVKCVATDFYLPLTTAQLRILARACEKVATDLGLGNGFCWVLRIPSTLTT